MIAPLTVLILKALSSSIWRSAWNLLLAALVDREQHLQHNPSPPTLLKSPPRRRPQLLSSAVTMKYNLWAYSLTNCCIHWHLSLFMQYYLFVLMYYSYLFIYPCFSWYSIHRGSELRATDSLFYTSESRHYFVRNVVDARSFGGGCLRLFRFEMGDFVILMMVNVESQSAEVF